MPSSSRWGDDSLAACRNDGRSLVTRNVRDFKKITGLRVVRP